MENNIGEQPKVTPPTSQENLSEAADVTVSTQQSGHAEATQPEGSPIGKFKNAESLHSAYLDLEREFTRKSQRLSKLESQVEQDKVEKSTPCFARAGWREEVKQFLASNQHALEHASEISDELMKDSNLATLPNSLELAYSKVLARKYKPVNQLIADKEFLEKNILKNSDIKNRIIKEYMQEVSLKKAAPVVLSNKGSQVGLALPEKPKSMEDAKKLVQKLFF